MNKKIQLLITELFQIISSSAIVLLPISIIIKISFFAVVITISNFIMLKKIKKDDEIKSQIASLNSSIETLLNKDSSCYFTVNKSNKIIEKKYNKNIESSILENIFIENSISNLEILRYVEKCFKTKEKIETTISIKKNQYMSMYFSLIVNYISNEKERYVTVILFDITEQKNTLRFLKESENKFSYFADIIPDTIVEYDMKGNILFLNKSAENIFGYSKNSLKNIMQVLIEEDQSKAVARIKSLIVDSEKNPNATIGPEEYRLKNSRDDTLYCKIVSSVRVNEFGVKTIISVVTDITDYKTQQKFLEKRLEFERLISSISKRFLTQTNRLETTQQSFIELSDFLNIDSITVFLNDREINKTTVEHSFIKKMNPKIENKKDQMLFLKNIYRLGKDERFVFSDQFTNNEESLHEYFYEHLKSKYVVTYKLDNAEYSLVLGFYFFNREQMLSDTDISAIEIFCELLSSLIFKELLNEKIIEKQESFDTLINESSLGVISISDNKITFINDSALKILEFERENCINKNASKVLNIYEIFDDVDREYTRNKRYMNIKGKIKEKNVMIELKPISLDEKNSTLITILDYTCGEENE